MNHRPFEDWLLNDEFLTPEQQRELSLVVLRPQKHTAAVKLEDDAARKYYEANRSEFQVPEQVRLDYVVLSLDTLATAKPALGPVPTPASAPAPEPADQTATPAPPPKPVQSKKKESGKGGLSNA